jgi:hypothetical protein
VNSRTVPPQSLSWAFEMIQLDTLRVLCETNKILSVTSKLFNMAVWNFYVVDCVVGHNILIEFSALKATCAWFASTCLSGMQALKEGWLGFPPLEITPRKVHFTSS